jgi:hypothetical protein
MLFILWLSLRDKEYTPSAFASHRRRGGAPDRSMHDHDDDDDSDEQSLASRSGERLLIQYTSFKIVDVIATLPALLSIYRPYCHLIFSLV